MNEMKSLSAEETFPRVERWLAAVARRYLPAWKKYGGDWDDLFQEACLAFTEVWPAWDPARSGVANYLRLAVGSKLRAALRKRERLGRDNAHAGAPAALAAVAGRTDPAGRLWELSHEAGWLVRLALRCPAEARARVKELGWAAGQVKRALAEAREYLT